METLFLFLRKSLTAFVFIVFAFVVTYVPVVPSSDVPEANAAATGSIVFDPTNTAQNVADVVQSTVSAGVDMFTFGKDSFLDGLAWSFAKRTISGMVTSLIDWVNSDFQGRPAFVTDLGGFLLNIADQEVGQAISDLGGIGSFICAPFRLDVQIAIDTQYQEYRGGPAVQSAPTCTLTGVIDNIEGFIAGTDPAGGLADWLTITATPQTYTPYGAILSAQANVRARLINAQGEELKILDFGAGFLSQSVCEVVAGGTGQQDCSIVTPGTVVANQLNKALGAGQDSLVAADEIDELINALFGQLTNRAITGVGGLLGLSGGNAYSYSGYDGSYLDELQGRSDAQAFDGTSQEVFANDLRAERNYQRTAQLYLDELATFIADPENSDGERNLAAILNDEIFAEINRVETNIVALTNFMTEYDSATEDRQIEILIAYSNLDITSELVAARNTNDWLVEAGRLGIGINIPEVPVTEPDETSTTTGSQP